MSTGKVTKTDIIYQTPTERWKDKSKHSQRDNIIKGIAVAILGSLGLVGLCGLAFMPLILPVGSLNPVTFMTYLFGNILLLGLGVGSFTLSVDWLDWRNYSNKEQVNKEGVELTTQSLAFLVSKQSSPIHRLENLKKYGVISEEIADKLKDVSQKYENCLEKMHVIEYTYSGLNVNVQNRFTNEIYKSYENLKKVKEDIEFEFEKLEADLLHDLPVLE